MKIPNRIKKFSSILDVLHANVDLTRFFIVIYKQPYSFHTVIEVKPFDHMQHQQVVFQLMWVPGNEYAIDIPDYICNVHIPVIQNAIYGRPY